MAEDMDKAMERIRDGYEAFNRGDFDESAKFVHPDIDWHRVADFETSLRGRDAVRENMEPAVFQKQEIEITAMEAIGDHVVVDTIFHAIGAGSGIQLDEGGCHLWRMEDGMGAEFRYFDTHDEAVAAARDAVSEDPG
jgi:ketosteroid isomerase-like protein